MRRLLCHATLAVGTEEEVVAAADQDDLGRAIETVVGASTGPLVFKRAG